MGSRVQALDLHVERDFHGKENCTEVLNLSRPDLVRDIHRGYFEAGADMVLTNSFGGSPVTLGEFELEDRAFEINKLAVELAREAAETFVDGRHRWVIGDIGPGTKLPSLGNIGYDALEAALRSGHLAGAGLDVLPVEPPVEPVPGLLRAYRAREEWQLGRVIITPHSAYLTPEAHLDIRVKSAETMRAALFTNQPQNVITPGMY